MGNYISCLEKDYNTDYGFNIAYSNLGPLIEGIGGQLHQIGLQMKFYNKIKEIWGVKIVEQDLEINSKFHFAQQLLRFSSNNSWGQF